MSDANQTAYSTQIENWRQQREEALRAPDSWLALTGLFALTEGRQTIGSASDSDIVLPASAPAHVGEIVFRRGEASLKVTTDEPVMVDGVRERFANLVDNSCQKPPTLVKTGSVTFFLHSFGDQVAIRVKDSTNPAIRAFGGCRWFAVKPEYRVQGQFAPHDALQEIQIGTVANTTAVYRTIGTVAFELHGQALRLLATDGGATGRLSFVFRDATAGKETYGPARFLTADINDNGAFDVDFNKAYNPPCAFTPYATCPLPSPANILPVRIEAGELYAPVAGGALH